YNVSKQNDIAITSASNKVQVKVSNLPEYGISLTQQPLLTVMPNALVNWVNVLTNTSYSDETVKLTLDVSPTLSNLKVYQDLNKNGIVDSADSEILFDNLSAQIKLGHNESLQLIVQALSDANGKSGDTADIKIGAVVLEDPSVSKAHATDELIIVEPDIAFTTPKFDENKTTSQLNENVYIDASYAQCNVQPEKPDQVWVTIISSLTGDKYSLKAIETGNNTGKYHLSAPTQNNANAIDDKIIQTLVNDTLTASLDACIAPSVGTGVNELPNDSDFTVRIDDLDTQINIIDDTPSLIVTKESDVKSAELGDYVSYTINVTNSSTSTAFDVQLKDALPRGFDYVNGSVRVGQSAEINKAQTTEFKTDGKYQVLSLGNMPSGESKKITYRVLVGAASLGGDGINRATAVANNGQGQSVASREAQWKIEVERGTINTDGIIVGKVYHDINRDGIQQKEDGELGVAGVRIYMENGNFVVTDPEGKYNFYGVSAKTHVLKVDRTTLPNATEMVTQSNRNAGDAGSRFVDLKYGELHRADFGIVGGMDDSTDRLNAELVARSKSVGTKNDALEQ
ncbi:MAG: DUF11 domain-containing protein, partial [Psychrobacter sp.]|nr:DUF11 domain-containing protein [Psychrobacter sp.]